jgi:hypothetical protein
MPPHAPSPGSHPHPRPRGHDAEAGLNRTQCGPAVDAYTRLASIVLNEQPMGAVLQQIADLAISCIPGADEASVTMVSGSRIYGSAFTGGLAAGLDDRQYGSGFSPTIEVARTGRAIAIDLAAHQHYPDFAYQACRYGIGQVLSLSLPGRKDIAGALTIYGYGATPFDTVTREIAQAFADHAAITALNCVIYAMAVDEGVQLRQALSSRAGIEQAKGIIMRDRSCNPDEAFAFLSAASSRRGQKVREIAQEVLRTAR